MIVQLHPRTETVQVETFPGCFMRREVPAGSITLHALHNEENDMAKSATKKAAPAAKEKAKTGPKGPRIGDVREKKIKLLVKENPRREGSLAHKRFSFYKDGMTVEDFIKKGGRMRDVRKDSARGRIAVS